MGVWILRKNLYIKCIIKKWNVLLKSLYQMYYKEIKCITKGKKRKKKSLWRIIVQWILYGNEQERHVNSSEIKYYCYIKNTLSSYV